MDTLTIIGMVVLGIAMVAGWAMAFKEKDDRRDADDQHDKIVKDLSRRLKDAETAFGEVNDQLTVRYDVVKTLHGSIAMPAGTIVSPFFSAVWEAHGLKDIGIQDIRDGRT